MKSVLAQTFLGVALALSLAPALAQNVKITPVGSPGRTLRQ